MVKESKTGVLVNMEKSLKEQLAQIAKKDNRSLNNLIVTILQQYADKQDNSNS